MAVDIKEAEATIEIETIIEETIEGLLKELSIEDINAIDLLILRMNN